MRGKQLLVNPHWLLIDLRIDFKRILFKVFIKRICCYLIETKTSIWNTFLWDSTKPRPYMYLYSAWIGGHDLPIQGLSCWFVKHFNISGSEVDTGSTCKKSTVRSRVPRGVGVGHATKGVGISVACSVVGYVQVVSYTKGWSVIRTWENSGTTVNISRGFHLNRGVAIDVI